MKRSVLVLLLFAACTGGARSQQSGSERAEWNRPLKPFRILDDVYYVGTKGLGCYLIATNRGLILLDAALPESAPLVEASIRALGFRLSDVKIILNTHAHFDHCGGLAQLKRDTGAQLAISAPDAAAVENGRADSGPSADTPFPAVRVDRRIDHGATVRLGSTVLTAHIIPGHTRGCTTWTMTSKDRGRPVTVLFFGSITVAGNQLFDNPAYPTIQQDYRLGFARLRRLSADVFLAPHASFFDLEDKLARLGKSPTNPFVKPGELACAVQHFELQYHRERQRQQHKRRNPGVPRT